MTYSVGFVSLVSETKTKQNILNDSFDTNFVLIFKNYQSKSKSQDRSSLIKVKFQPIILKIIFDQPRFILTELTFRV